ncbi:SufD family Fe-S cluster assembly protein [Alteraurantiacibacter buctensis]|uniref:SufD family Fe-S cluster assembly protein n=1 Tax=Alteraurantiacibacter buctensis TaxID=1503981 RepID=A0A844YXK6_9SPHN|nr:SufD family Fe-S cluster assembly protein [Alteraurantiacibacter buctensis]MXO70473.1 SufD family Fe-S cluster assembly protein [Alteraurantiacibacter buctensis]
MTLAATLPTNRDEEWRYADIPAVTALGADALDAWHVPVLAPGEVRTKDLLLDDSAPGLHRVRITVGAGARAELFAVISASSYTRLEVEVTLGEGAHFEFGAVTIGGGDVVREAVTRVRHAEPSATSHQVIRAVHWGQATGNFLGRIEVARHAQKTDAEQDFKGLILERGASANARPELEIYADDVKCAHGAAIGQMDANAAFYMASRGIDPQAAKVLLVRAFIADALAAKDDSEALLDAALAALEGAAL